MDHPAFIACRFMKNSIGLKRVKYYEPEISTFNFYGCYLAVKIVYALQYFCNVELLAFYAILVGNDITSFNVTPI